MFKIENDWISIDKLNDLVHSGEDIGLSESVKAKIQECRDYLDKKVESAEELIYGINTGFGSLCNTAISADDLETLQRNLVVSHACGAGDEIPSHIVKRMLLLKALGLSHGHSGAQVETVERLLRFYNHDILPVVYKQGSLGASGDLAPLAHMSLPLFGEGEVYYKGVKTDSASMLVEEGLEPMKLRSKEGLALLNGTQFMSAFGSYCCSRAKQLYDQANLIAALSLSLIHI